MIGYEDKTVYKYHSKYHNPKKCSSNGSGCRKFYKAISRQTAKGVIPKTFVTHRTNLRGDFQTYRNLIQLETLIKYLLRQFVLFFIFFPVRLQSTNKNDQSRHFLEFLLLTAKPKISFGGSV